MLWPLFYLIHHYASNLVFRYHGWAFALNSQCVALLFIVFRKSIKKAHIAAQAVPEINKCPFLLYINWHEFIQLYAKQYGICITYSRMIFGKSRTRVDPIAEFVRFSDVCVVPRSLKFISTPLVSSQIDWIKVSALRFPSLFHRNYLNRWGNAILLEAPSYTDAAFIFYFTHMYVSFRTAHWLRCEHGRTHTDI